MSRPKGAKDKKPRKRRRQVGYAVAFKGRRTYSLTDAYNKQQAIKLTRENKRRGGDEVVEVRRLTPKEVEIAQSGKWVKSRPKGFRPEDRGYGPKSNAFKRRNGK